MRILVCGGRHYDDKEAVFRHLNNFIDTLSLEPILSGFVNGKPIGKYPEVVVKEDIEILEGGCYTGADHFARDFARDNELTFINVPARWTSLGRSAGPIRNQRMLDNYKPDVVIGFHDNIKESKGTRDMLNRSYKAVPTYLVSKGIINQVLDLI